MSRFHIGQDVYVGFCPDSLLVNSNAARFRCTCGVIHSGPFEADERMLERWWFVRVDGRQVGACERILFPFEPPAREVDIESVLELTE